jgi:predicted Zn-dependent protease with MMP-like domain
VLPIDAETFEELVGEALDGVPPELMALLQNVVVLTADEPPPGEEPDLLGLYEGIPLTERDGQYSGVLPDHITIFRGPTLRFARDWDEAVREVRITVVHEIAHHFGIDDDRLHELGYG